MGGEGRGEALRRRGVDRGDSRCDVHVSGGAWATRGCWLDGRTGMDVLLIILDAMQVCVGGLKLVYITITTYFEEQDFTVNVLQRRFNFILFYYFDSSSSHC